MPRSVVAPRVAVLELVFTDISSAVLSIDRMENHSHVRRRYPRYHSSLFRGQPAWDPHTHVVLPLSVLSPPKTEGEHRLGRSAYRHGWQGALLLLANPSTAFLCGPHQLWVKIVEKSPQIPWAHEHRGHWLPPSACPEPRAPLGSSEKAQGHLCVSVPILTTPSCASAAPTAVPTLAGGEGNYTVESSSPRQALPEPEPALTVIILIMYRTLGGLLPARYQVDRRSVRYVLLPFLSCEHWWREAAWIPLNLGAGAGVGRAVPPEVSARGLREPCSPRAR